MLLDVNGFQFATGWLHDLGLSDTKLLGRALPAVLLLAGLVVGGGGAGLGSLVMRRPLAALVELLGRTPLRRVLTAA